MQSKKVYNKHVQTHGAHININYGILHYVTTELANKRIASALMEYNKYIHITNMK